MQELLLAVRKTTRRENGRKPAGRVALPRKLVKDPKFQFRVLPMIHPPAHELKKDTNSP